MASSLEERIDDQDHASVSPTLTGSQEASNELSESKDAGDDLEAVQSTPVYPEPKSLPQEIFFVFVVCAAQLMTQAGLAVSIVPLKIISASFNNSTKDMSWASAGYSLTVGTFIFMSGRLGDVYGHRLMFIIGFLWFGLWSLLAGISVWSNPIFFYCCRAFQGIGPAMLLPNGVAILGRTYPPGPRKGMVFCMFGAVAPGGFVFGGVFSSLLAERLWWPWAYWIMAIACVVFAVLGFLVIPPMYQEIPRKDLSTFERLDISGAIVGISGLILINFAWNQAAVVGFKAPYTYALLIVGILLLALFLYIERKAVYPLLPQSALRGEVGWVLACIAAGWSSFGVVVFYYFNIMENIEGNSGLLVLAKWSGAAVSGALAAIMTGFLLGRVDASIIMLIAMLAFSAGQALLASMPIGQIYWANAFVLSLVTPFGMDMSFPSASLILSDALPQKHQGVAGSLVSTVVNYSISMGLGFAGVVEYYVDDNGTNNLKGDRGATYTGVGLAGSGVVIATCFVIITQMKKRRL